MDSIQRFDLHATRPRVNAPRLMVPYTSDGTLRRQPVEVLPVDGRGGGVSDPRREHAQACESDESIVAWRCA